MHSIRIQITIITILAILTSILAVFTASFLSIKEETDQNSVRMMNLIEQDTQKNLEKYYCRVIFSPTSLTPFTENTFMPWAMRTERESPAFNGSVFKGIICW